MKITPEVIEALSRLRQEVAGYAGADLMDAFSTLDNAGVFAAIDEATGYDVDPAPERVSKCTCSGLQLGKFQHFDGCPGDPAEWGDSAFRDEVAR